MARYVPAAQIRELFQVHSSTLRGWAEAGRIECRRLPGGKRLYSKQQLEQLIGGSTSVKRSKFIYARVSSHHQKADLERQIQDLQQAYPNHQLVKDVASGLNWKRPGLLSLLERVSAGTVSEVVVAYRDRLCRFGLELVEWIFSKHGVRLIVHNKMETAPNPTTELADYLLAVANFFVARNNGQRAGQKRRARSEAKQRADQKVQEEGAYQLETHSSGVQVSQDGTLSLSATARPAQAVDGRVSMDI